jgi:hypothetical protein
MARSAARRDARGKMIGRANNVIRPLNKEAQMMSFMGAAAIGLGLLIVAVWVEIRERRVAIGDGDYRFGRKRS